MDLVMINRAGEMHVSGKSLLINQLHRVDRHGLKPSEVAIIVQLIGIWGAKSPSIEKLERRVVSWAVDQARPRIDAASKGFVIIIAKPDVEQQIGSNRPLGLAIHAHVPILIPVAKV